MEPVVPPPSDEDLQFLTKWGDPWDRPRGRRAAAISALVHAAIVLGVILAPTAIWNTPQIMEQIVTPLVAPLTALTQRDPNEGKINKEFDVQASQPRPRIQIAPGVAPKPFNPEPPVPAPAPRPVALPEPPKVEEKAPKVDVSQLAQTLPQPKIEPVERPKLVLEDPAPASSIQPGQGLPLPKATADAAIRGAMGGGPGGKVGGAATDLPASAGLDPSKMRLLSDPMGVDFKPYLTQILAAVKRYWLAIWPDAARQGRSGRVVIQFSVDRFGTVPKLVIAAASGTDALDRAAVAAVAGCVPFPSLPREYKGDQIRLELNFTYNVQN